MFKVYLLISLSFFNFSETNSWNGITPLVSTRIDVEKIIGEPEPTSKSEGSAYYRTESKRVFVLYSTGDCDIKTSNGWSIEKGKVISMSVVPSIKPKLAEYKFDRSKFITYRDDFVTLLNYSNEKDGITFAVNTLDETIVAFDYYPKSKDDYLKCN